MSSDRVDSYMPLFGRDFFVATVGWPDAAVGAYIRLLIVQWEQGSVPGPLEELLAIAPTVVENWGFLESKFPAGSDGRRRNARCEEHRATSMELKAVRSEAGKLGNRVRWGDRKAIAERSPGDRRAIAKGIAKGIAKRSPPTPTPTPTSSPDGEEYLGGEREPTHAGMKPGWAAAEWQAFVTVWNATRRAAQWKPLTAPDGWPDVAATPGWMEKARAALDRLPGCAFFATPLAVTRFMADGFVDRILAGEFDHAKATRPGEAPKPAAAVSSRRWRDDACENMTDAQYAAWRSSAGRPGSVAESFGLRLAKP